MVMEGARERSTKAKGDRNTKGKTIKIKETCMFGKEYRERTEKEHEYNETGSKTNHQNNMRV